MNEERRQLITCGYCGMVLPKRDAVQCHTIHPNMHRPCEDWFCTPGHQELHRRDREGE